jgi:hypothetical protein
LNRNKRDFLIDAKVCFPLGKEPVAEIDIKDGFEKEA